MEARISESAPSAASSTAESAENPAMLDLGLGLSLGTRSTGDHCRILTAEDLGSRSPVSSSSSSSSSTPANSGRTVSDRGSRSNQVVGWPPVRSFRMNSFMNKSKGKTAGSEKKRGIVGSSSFVKVNMDGDPIGRKVDLSAHTSYESLAQTLDIMFSASITAAGGSINWLRTSMLLNGSSEFSLTYEDKDGDWMLVGDVPWRMFMDNVKRLRIMRTTDANGLATGFHSCNAAVPRSLV